MSNNSIIPCILFVENDTTWQNLIKDRLGDKFKIQITNNGNEAWELFLHYQFDLVLTNLQIPERHGIELIKLIRNKNLSIPIVIFSSSLSEEEVIQGLNAGADNYISKETPLQEFIAHLQATFRRCNEYAPQLTDHHIFKISANTTLHSTSHKLYIEDKATHLTSMEAKLLKLLASQLNGCVTKEHITQTLWGNNDPEKNTYLDKYLVKIRKYLKKDPTIGIINIRGEGFCLSNQL